MQVVLGPEGGSERGPEPGQGATCRRLDSSPDTRGHPGILAPALQGNRGRLCRGQGPGWMEQGRQAPSKPPFQCPRPATSCPSHHQAPSQAAPPEASAAPGTGLCPPGSSTLGWPSPLPPGHPVSAPEAFALLVDAALSPHLLIETLEWLCKHRGRRPDLALRATADPRVPGLEFPHASPGLPLAAGRCSVLSHPRGPRSYTYVFIFTLACEDPAHDTKQV